MRREEKRREGKRWEEKESEGKRRERKRREDCCMVHYIITILLFKDYH